MKADKKTRKRDYYGEVMESTYFYCPDCKEKITTLVGKVDGKGSIKYVCKCSKKWRWDNKSNNFKK